MADLSIFKLDSETITIKDATARQAADSAKTLSTTASGNATTALNKVTELESEISALKSDLANKLYPVGSIYISVNATNPAELFGGTWELVGSGKTLWGADSTHAAGTTIDAGLPNITGWLEYSAGGYGIETSHLGGAFYTDGYYNNGNNGYVGGSGNGTLYQGLHIDASRSNAIYGNSSTVQPPAYVVYMWKRTA